MTIKLKDIAIVSSGLTFRSRIEAMISGNVGIIQMKDLGKDNLVYLEHVMRINYEQPKPSQLVRKGDIVFRSRGQTNTAAILNEETKNTIVAAPLLRVRPDTKKVLPAFLLWWINQPIAQNYLRTQSKGTMIKMVSKQTLEDLEVSLPSLEQQHKVADFFSLSMQEQHLLEEIKNRKMLYTQKILLQIVSAKSKTSQ